MSYGLKNLAQTRAAGLQPVVGALNSVLQAAVVHYNSETGPRAFGRPPTEKIPTNPRQLTDFRGRIGGLIEYAFGIVIDQMLEEDEAELVFAFDVIQQYPDFYLRGPEGDVLLRIDFKALHDESDEYSARFDLPLADIRTDDDLLIYVAWRWNERQRIGRSITFPEVLEGLCVPAIEVATERDLRLLATGGQIGADGKPYVRARQRKGGQSTTNPWSLDTNFGKIDRIIHSSRRPEDLTGNMLRFAEFAARHTTARSTSSATPASDELSPA